MRDDLGGASALDDKRAHPPMLGWRSHWARSSSGSALAKTPRQDTPAIQDE
jgi:hypothetical protein